MYFKDRREAARLLSDKLKKLNLKNPVVLAIPRGGAILADIIAKELGTFWDFVVPRKIGAPNNKELAIGAITEDGTILLNHPVVSSLKISKEYIDKAAEKELDEVKRRMAFYRGNRPYPELRDKSVILVDDGIATGFTVFAAIKSLRRRGAEKIIVAVPVAPKETAEDIKEVVDAFVCLYTPTIFYAVGEFYENFEQVEDEEVISLFDKQFYE